MTSFRTNFVPYLNSAQRSLGKGGGRSCSGSETDMSSTSNENLSVEDKQALLSGVRQEPQGEERIATELSNTLIIHDNQDSPFYEKDYLSPPSSSTGYCSSPSPAKTSPHRLPRPTLPVQELKEIPKHYLDQSEVLKHLAYEVSQHLSTSSGSLRKAGRHHHHHHKGSMDKNRLSLSHPDLSKAMPRPKTKGRAATFDAEYSNPGKEVLALALENVGLKQQLEVCLKKVSKLQQLESEVLRLQDAHQELVRSSEKREKLEMAVRSRLEGEVRRLQELASQYKEHMESSLSSTIQSATDSSAADDSTNLRKELNTREVLIGQLLSQNKELAAERERQHLEIQAQQATLEEQRTHIAILDNALVTAQANVVRLETEARTQAERAARLGALQIAADRRLQAEQRLRAQLERDQRDGGKPSEPAQDLRAKVRENEEKVITLEAEVARWEQRYLEESTLRQLAMDAASAPKDAKIAALEKTSQECEKIIAQARTDKLKHMDELYAAQRKSLELEGRIKDLESKLAERDAMITVLQSRTQDKSDLVGWARNHVRSASSVALTSTSIRDPVTTTVTSSSASSSSCMQQPESSSSLPEKTRLNNKDTLISILRAERERHPSHYWQV